MFGHAGCAHVSCFVVGVVSELQSRRYVRPLTTVDVEAAMATAAAAIAEMIATTRTSFLCPCSA
eukprot:scaffold3619_cov328-Prasinococcus_capsulatus_cf.AAC.8